MANEEMKQRKDKLLAWTRTPEGQEWMPFVQEIRTNGAVIRGSDESEFRPPMKYQREWRLGLPLPPEAYDAYWVGYHNVQTAAGSTLRDVGRILMHRVFNVDPSMDLFEGEHASQWGLIVSFLFHENWHYADPKHWHYERYKAEDEDEFRNNA
jgi:hypothetical protein